MQKQNEESISGEVMAKAFIAGLAIDIVVMTSIAAYKGESIVPPSNNNPVEKKETPTPTQNPLKDESKLI